MLINYINSFLWTFSRAITASEALGLVDLERLLHLSIRRPCRAVPLAKSAANALLLVNGNAQYSPVIRARADRAVRADLFALPTP